MDIVVLKEILNSQKEKWQGEWDNLKHIIFEKLKKIGNILLQKELTKSDIEKLRNLCDEIPQKQMYQFWFPQDLDQAVNIFNNSLFRNLLEVAKDTNAENLEKNLEKIREVLIEIRKNPEIKNVGIATCSTWMAVVNHKFFMPINSNTLSDETLEKINFRRVVGGNWDIDGFVDFIKAINNVKEELSIETATEIAYYLSKYRGKSSTTLKNYFTSKGYHFPDHLIAQFYTALKTKGFVILSGLSGTGKTKIALELAELLSNSNKNTLFLSVRPDWRDSKPLLGYYNPLDGKYYKTPLLEFLLRAIKDYEKNKENAMPYFIILDEMNLSHVEYYFADFLSVLESGRDESGLTRESIKLHNVDKVVEEQGIPKEIKLPPNLYIIGTVNIDETTYMFSPKVLDRAFTIEFHDVELDKYGFENSKELTDEEMLKLREKVLEDLKRGGKVLAVSKNDDIKEALQDLKASPYWQILQQLNKALEPYDLHFGYRVVDEIALFFKNAKESWNRKIVTFESEDEIFDLAILMKILPKFHGNRKKLENPLKAVFKICLKENQSLEELNSEKIIKMLQNWENERKKFRFPHTAKKVLRMLRQLYEIGFASFS